MEVMKISLILIFLVINSSGAQQKRALMKGVFWEVKPYIFTNEKGEIDGIIPKVFARANAFCNRNPNVTVIDFVKRFDSRQQFIDSIESGFKYDEGYLKGINEGEMFLVPVMNEFESEWESANRVRSFSLMKTNEIVVIVPRKMIDLPNKILNGIASCKIIFVIVIPLAIFFSIVIWFIERVWNQDIERSFILGTGTTFWWSVVSMTTVGYGDITPKSPVGRFIALFWLVVGIMLGCVMTATMTDVVSGIGNLSVYGQSVAVLRGSYEEKVASRDYQANTVPAASYEDVLNLVREEKVFAAMMSADIAAWYQTEILGSDGKNPPLHIVDKLPAHLYVRCAMNSNPSKELIDVIRCMHTNREEIYDYTQTKYQRYCHTETIHIGTVREVFESNVAIQFLFGLVTFLIALGLIHDVIVFKMTNQNWRRVFHPKQVLDRLLGKQNGIVGSRTSSSSEADENYGLVEKASF
eukprot:TCONS_00021663-protein